MSTNDIFFQGEIRKIAMLSGCKKHFIWNFGTTFSICYQASFYLIQIIYTYK